MAAVASKVFVRQGDPRGRQAAMDASLFTAGQLAKEFGLSEITVKRRIRSVQPSGTGPRGVPAYRLVDVLGAILGGQARLEDDDAAMLPPKEQLDFYRAKREALKFAAEEKELIPAMEVEDRFSELVKLLVQSLDTLPDVLERDCGLPADAVTRAQMAIDNLREEMWTLAERRQ